MGSRLREVRFFLILFSFGVLVWVNWLKRPVLSEPLALGTQEAVYFQASPALAPGIRRTEPALDPAALPEESASTRLESNRSSPALKASPGDPTAAAANQPDPILRVVIPFLKLDAKVEAVPYSRSTGTWDVGDIGEDLALLEPATGEESSRNIVIAGHVTLRDLGRGPFRYLYLLKPDEKVYLFSEKSIFTYRVRAQKVVRAEDVEITGDTGNAQLTLLTCTNWDEASRRYLLRRVIFADLIDVEPASMAATKR